MAWSLVAYERCDQVWYLRDLVVLDQRRDAADVDVDFYVKDTEQDEDPEPYHPDEHGRLEVPAAEFPEAGQRWAYAVANEAGRRYFLGSGTITIRAT